MGKRIEWKRVNEAFLEDINELFDLYETVSWIKLEYRYNSDETGEP